MILTRERIATYARDAGFSGADLNIAVAVALAESGGDASAHNSTPPDDSYGLWQINMLGKLGPDRRKWFGISSNTELFTPTVNAKAAKKIRDSSGWKAWTTYTSGKYKQYLQDEKTLIGGGGIANAPAQTVSNVKDALSSVPDAISNFTNNFAKFGASMLALGVAVTFLILGIVILMRNSGVAKAGKKAAKVAAKVAA